MFITFIIGLLLPLNDRRQMQRMVDTQISTENTRLTYAAMASNTNGSFHW